MDDIEDNSKLRRGIPVAHSIFGVAQTINSANYVYFLALEKTMALGHAKGVEIFTSKVAHQLYNIPSLLTAYLSAYGSGQLLELHRGQGKDIYWRDSYICPTENEYMEMVRQSKCVGE